MPAPAQSTTPVYLYADEFGNLDFSNGKGATRYFGLTTVTFFNDQQARTQLDQLRYNLAREGISHKGPFHASTDSQQVRDRVYAAIEPHFFRVDCTILEKRKSQPQVRSSPERFYQYAWYYHMKHLAPKVSWRGDELFVVAATIGSKKKTESFHAGVDDVMEQVSRTFKFTTAQWPANSDAGLQVADYCCWAIQRKWEGGDSRSYALITDKIASEFDIFKSGSKFYY